MLFVVYSGFLGFQVLGFTGRELAAIDALRDAILLIVLALRDRCGRVSGGCRRAGNGLLSKRGWHAQNDYGRRTQDKIACVHDDVPPSRLLRIKKYKCWPPQSC